MKPKSLREAIAELFDTQFIVAVLFFALAFRIVDSLLRNGNEGVQSQVLLVASNILSVVGGAYFGAALAKASGTPAPAVVVPAAAVTTTVMPPNSTTTTTTERTPSP